MSGADILLVTVTKVERQAALGVFEKAAQATAKPFEIEGRHYWDLGQIRGARAALTQCEMGASLPAVQKGIEALCPDAVIMVGIAFGVNEAKQKIGEILVTRQLLLYEPQRVGAQKVPRGDRPRASDRLLNRMVNAEETWSGAKVRFGLVLTGEKLVDNAGFRNELIGMEPEAIGGEMEGHGLYVACQDKKVDWILIKAICDWGDGNKEQDKDARQLLAAKNAAEFVLHALQLTPFVRSGSPAVAGQVEKAGHSTLPVQPFFFGRERELAAIAEAILPEARTWGALIDGPGGIGKTALAVRAAYLAPVSVYPKKIFVSAKIRELTPGGEQPLEDFMLPNFLALVTEIGQQLGHADLARTPENERAKAVRNILAGAQALLVIDNLETFSGPEQVRLYHFLKFLPDGCKAIVTSRRRSDVDARVVRLDRLEWKDALDLLRELAKNNARLAAASEAEWRTLYEVTGGNPLLLRWTAGQLGRRGSQCHSVADASEFLRNAPPDNDPLEYIFGDLLDTFSDNETAVLAALTHFTQPAKVKWIASATGLSEREAQTALDDLADRALLFDDPSGDMFYLPPLTAEFLRRKCPEAVQRTSRRLVKGASALALENGYENYDRFPALEAEWPVIAAALPGFEKGESVDFQELCNALSSFMNSSGRWDEWLWVEQQAEKRAQTASDFLEAGWRAHRQGWTRFLRQQAAEVLACAERAETHWSKAEAGARELASAKRLRGLAHSLTKDYALARSFLQEALEIYRTSDSGHSIVAACLNDIGAIEEVLGEYLSAEFYYREALQIANEIGDREGSAALTNNLSALALVRGDCARCEQLARDALVVAESRGLQLIIGGCCCILAFALARLNRREEGIPYARRAVEIYTKLGVADRLQAARKALQECSNPE